MQRADRALTRIDQPQAPASSILHMIELHPRCIVLHVRNRRQPLVKLGRRASHFQSQGYFGRRCVPHPPAMGGQIASTSPSANRVTARSLGGTNTPFNTTSLTDAAGMPSGAMIESMVALASISIGMAWFL